MTHRFTVSGIGSSALGRFTSGCLAAVAFVMASMLPVLADSAPRDRQAAEELLEDGQDAAADRTPDLAREIFNHLIKTYPNTPQARVARSELRRLPSQGAAKAGVVQRQVIVAPRQDTDGWEQRVLASPTRLDELRRGFLTKIGDRLFFSENSAAIGGRARAVIDSQARWIKANPDLIVTLIGRSDDGGSDSADQALAGARVKAVRDALVTAGVDETRLVLDPRGRRDPIAVCKSAMCQAQNRHVETMLSDPRNAGSPDGPAVTRGDRATTKVISPRQPLER